MTTTDTEKRDAAPSPPTPQTRAMARTDAPPLARIAGSYSPKEAAIRLAYVAHSKEVHLVTPSLSVGEIPEGFSITLSKIEIDVERDTYPVAGGDDERAGGKRGLSKTALELLSVSLGIRWDPHLSRRLDDGSDPRYVLWQAVGRMRSLDGTEIVLQGSKEVDLRPGSPQVEALEARAKKKRKTADVQIREMRLHIASHAETKARLRAIRSIGLRSSYTVEELRRPFVVARLSFTGQSEDPELRRAFALKIADAAIGARESLYGVPPAPLGVAPPPAAPPRVALPAPTPPPALGARPFDPDEDDADIADLEEQRRDAKPVNVPLLIPGGKSKGTPLAEASDRDLTYWAERLEKELADDTSRDADRDHTLAAAMRAELARRAQAPTTGDAA